MRLNYDEEDKVEVQMSPLIDCVFLLLIFFLVTTMMKKWEMQIPLSLPSMTSSLSTTRAGEEAVIIAVDEEKNVYQVVGHDAYTGENHYVPISDLNTFLTELRNSEGTEIAIDVAWLPDCTRKYGNRDIRSMSNTRIHAYACPVWVVNPY